jgi:PKD repeat protein
MTYSTSTSPAVALANGSYYATLYSYTPAGGFCDSITQMFTVSCGSGTTTVGCQANSQFYIFADSLNAGNYFAYNLSWTSGTASYLWDFGDGTTSSQQYPFHQYAIPGQYIVCLTVTSTSGTTTCTDTYCDSSSVQRMAAGFQMSQVNVIPLSVTGIKQTEKEIGLIAFPNPIADELTIEVATTNDNKLTFVLVDALGRLVLTGNLNNSKTTINTSNLEKGFYSLSVTNEKGSSLKTIKLVK